jgi:hypothetical protein
MMVIWKPWQDRDIYGRSILMSAGILNIEGSLILQRIRSMPRKKPISYNTALIMMWDHWDDFGDTKESRRQGREYIQHGNWIKWLSSEGYHIQLIGDEFEIYNLDASNV